MAQELDSIIRPSLEHQGFRLVRAKLMEVGGKRTLQVMIERLDGAPLLMDDCAEMSHHLSALLDVHDPIQGAYHLEVTSPGIDRPLVSREDFTRFAGFDVKLETAYPISGRKRYRGRLLGMEEEQVQLQDEQERFAIPFDQVATAKLILTDELIAAYQEGRVTH